MYITYKEIWINREIQKALEYSDYELHVLEMWLASCKVPELSISI